MDRRDFVFSALSAAVFTGSLFSDTEPSSERRSGRGTRRNHLMGSLGGRVTRIAAAG